MMKTYKYEEAYSVYYTNITSNFVYKMFYYKILYP